MQCFILPGDGGCLFSLWETSMSGRTTWWKGAMTMGFDEIAWPSFIRACTISEYFYPGFGLDDWWVAVGCNLRLVRFRTVKRRWSNRRRY